MNCIFIVYDERRRFDEDKALVLVACNTAKEARDYVKKDFPNGVIVRGWFKKVNGENIIVDEEILN